MTTCEQFENVRKAAKQLRDAMFSATNMEKALIKVSKLLSFFKTPLLMRLVEENFDCIEELINSELYSLKLNNQIKRSKQGCTIPINNIYGVLLNYENSTISMFLYNIHSNDMYEVAPLPIFYTN